MRKITAGLFIALDGVVEAPDQWHFPYFNEEMGAAVDATLGSADTVLFGRTTYVNSGGPIRSTSNPRLSDGCGSTTSPRGDPPPRRRSH